MMKLTVAFLASLAAADAANAHGRRHVRRQGYGYGGGYGGESSSIPVSLSTVPYPPSSAASSTALPVESSTALPIESSTALPVESSSALPVESSSALPVESSSALPVESSGTAPGGGYGGETSSSVVDTTALPAETSSAASSVVVETPSSFPTFPGTGVPSYTGPGTGTGVVPSSSAIAESASSEVTYPGTGVPTFATTGAPTFPTTGFSFPVTDVAANSTITEYITSVIYSTQIFTLPVSGTTSLVTSVVPIATTICTKPTGVEASSGVVAVETPVSEVTYVTTETLTYTIGTGPTAHPVTTEIVKTLTETVVQTVYITQPGTPQETGVPASSGLPEGPEGPEGTTTLSSTSTTTKYITVYPTPEGTVPAEAEGSTVPTAPGGGEGEGCAPPVTVTVTAQETVTVTAGQDVPVTTSAAAEDFTTSLISETAVPTVPYPLSNSTAVLPTGGSTGFLTFTKPTGPPAGPTGGFTYPPPPPSGTGVPVPESSLPSFSLPSEVSVPSSTALPVEESTSAAPTPTGGYGYGGYKKRFGLF